MANTLKGVDWAKIERMWRAGLLSQQEIARQMKVKESTLRMHAKSKGWKRELTQDVRNLTRTKLVENLASMYKEGEESIKEMMDEQIIAEASRTQVEVVRQHQSTLKHGHELTVRMLNELDAATTHIGELSKMISSTIAPKRKEAVLKAISLPSRATVLRELASASRMWMMLERQAFSIYDEREKDLNKVDDANKSAEELRQEILSDAQRMGLNLSDEVDKPNDEKVH